MSYSVTGIQQVGIGVEAMEEAWAWYRWHFGMDVPIFKDAGAATLMARYTGGEARQRVAVLAASMHGGGAFEVWQFTARTPSDPVVQPVLGDLGVSGVILKSRNLTRSFASHRKARVVLSDAPVIGGDGNPCYLVKDPYGNIFRVEEDREVFHKTEHFTGGVKGALIGVSDIDRSIELYGGVLGYSKIAYDLAGAFADFSPLSGGEGSFRRVRLEKAAHRSGGFSPLLGTSYIELVQALDREPRKIFEGRFWGDKGYIHLCFDVHDTESLKEACKKAGFPFTVDSNDAFEMGEANGRFAYTEDPDGTLIELIEAFKVPLIKKLGWYLDLGKRDPEKPIPKWMLKALTFSRVRDRK